MLTADPQSSEPAMAPVSSEQDLLDRKYLIHLLSGRYPAGSVYDFLHITFRNPSLEPSEFLLLGKDMLDRLADEGLLIRTPYGAKLTLRGRRRATAA